MRIDVAPSVDELHERVAQLIAEHIRSAVEARGSAAIGLSGGDLPPPMFRRLAAIDLPWSAVHVFQIDERVAPDGHPDRNAVAIQRELLDRTDAVGHLMPVTAEDLDAAAGEYARALHEICGGVLDVAQLGIGDDGHTASLVPGDPVLEVSDADIAMTGEYRGRRRMTFTYPSINRCRAIVWLVTGPQKATVVKAMLEGGDVPAAGVAKDSAVLAVTADAAPEWVGQR